MKNQRYHRPLHLPKQHCRHKQHRCWQRRNQQSQRSSQNRRTKRYPLIPNTAWQYGRYKYFRPKTSEIKFQNPKMTRTTQRYRQSIFRTPVGDRNLHSWYWCWWCFDCSHNCHNCLWRNPLWCSRGLAGAVSTTFYFRSSTAEEIAKEQQKSKM